MRSQGVTVESARLLSVDLTAPAARVQLPSGAVNAAAIAGGVTAAALVIAAAIGLGVWWGSEAAGDPCTSRGPTGAGIQGTTVLLWVRLVPGTQHVLYCVCVC